MKSGNDPDETKCKPFQHSDRLTDSNRARPCIQALTRPVRPRSLNPETMQYNERICSKRTARYADDKALYCDGCGTTAGTIRLVDVEDPDGRLTVCSSCEALLEATIVREVIVDDS